VSLVVNTNVASIDTQRYLTNNQNMLNQALQRLSSGLRINSAADDVAGYAIAQRMNAQVNGDNVASRNANDGISLAQTALGSLSTISANLQQIRQLAVQAANASNSSADRASLNSAAQQLLQEIDREATSASFNGVNLLDGSFKAQQFQVGANAGQTISISNISSARIANLGSSDTAAVTAGQNAGGTNAMADGDLLINGIDIGPSLASTDTASTASAGASAIAKAAAINAKSSVTGVTATVNDTEVDGSSMTATAATGTITINGTSIAVQTTASTITSRASVVAAINAKSDLTGVTAVDTGSDADGVRLVANDGRNVVVAFGTVTAAETGIAAAGTYTGSYTLNSQSAFTLSSGPTGTLSNAGLVAGTYNPQTAYASTIQGAAGAGTAIVAGDFSINGVLVGASLASDDTASYVSASASAIAKAAAINKLSAQTGVTATADPNVVADDTTMTAGGAHTGTLFINGVQTGAITTTASTTTAQNRAAVIAAINAVSGQTGVVAVDTQTDGGGVQLVAADGRNISVVQSSTGTLTAADTGLNSALLTAASGATPSNADYQGDTFRGTITLSSTTQFTVASGTTGTSLNTSLGLYGGTYGAGKSGQALSTIDLSTADGANNALVAIDNAINSINSSSGSLGSVQSRFQAVINNLGSTSENLSAAVSRIQDADFAAETANYTKYNVLQQAATSMLSQANSNPQQVLSLLQRL
jgi:flagellin